MVAEQRWLGATESHVIGLTWSITQNVGSPEFAEKASTAFSTLAYTCVVEAARQLTVLVGLVAPVASKCSSISTT